MLECWIYKSTVSGGKWLHHSWGSLLPADVNFDFHTGWYQGLVERWWREGSRKNAQEINESDFTVWVQIQQDYSKSSMHICDLLFHTQRILLVSCGCEFSFGQRL